MLLSPLARFASVLYEQITNFLTYFFRYCLLLFLILIFLRLALLFDVSPSFFGVAITKLVLPFFVVVVVSAFSDM